MVKITTTLVKKIRELRALGYHIKDISKLLQISVSTVDKYQSDTAYTKTLERQNRRKFTEEQRQVNRQHAIARYYRNKENDRYSINT